MIPIEGSLVADASRRTACSALPDAPVVVEEHRTAGRRRRFLARSLRSLADRVEPTCCVDTALRPHPR